MRSASADILYIGVGHRYEYETVISLFNMWKYFIILWLCWSVIVCVLQSGWRTYTYLCYFFFSRQCNPNRIVYTHWEHWWLLLEWVGALSEIGDNWVSCWNNVRCISQMNDVAYFPRLIWCAFFIIYIAGSLNIWIEKLALVFLWVVWILLISDVIFLYFFCSL